VVCGIEDLNAGSAPWPAVSGRCQRAQHIMARYFQYWIGVAALAALTVATPIWLIADDKGIEAALIGIPTLLFLAGAVAATLKMLRKE
jgi:hypothetical protein